MTEPLKINLPVTPDGNDPADYDDATLEKLNRQIDELHQMQREPDKPVMQFNLASFALNGSGAEMEAKMLDDKFILGRMAILGQSTVIYAKPNTGKTLLAIAAGLFKSADEGHYSRLLVSRPIFPLGRDLGFLPGDIEEKLSPWMQPIFDNVELLLGSVEEQGKRKRGYKELVDLGLLEIEPLTYIRGRSIPKQYMIVDEAQNLTPHEIKTIITRAGEGTKIILTGDPYQIDNPYIDSSSNGLTYAVEKFKDQEIAGHITLTKGERSSLAELAANLL